MNEAPRVRVCDVRVYLRRIKTRMPFRYGKAVLTEQPIAHVRATVETPTGEIMGVSGAALPPLWFDKDPAKSHADNIRDLLASLRAAADRYQAAPAGDAWTLHRSVQPRDLTAGYGVALLDAAVIDALCRFSGMTFHEGLKRNLFGWTTDLLPERPLDRIFVRHTIGLSDPIDVATSIGDGLPETLEEVIREYGIRYFKAKISGDIPASLERLRRIAEVLDRDAGDYSVTLDGNEQFVEIEAVAEFVRRVAADPALGNFWRRTLWIEQPLERSRALLGSVREIDRLKPMIIDESDGTDEAVDRALALGYRGVSAKNCKGIFRTLHSFVQTRRAGGILSSEDLTNVPVVPLQQDLCVAAALGIPHSERNGHHYVRGFAFLSPRESEAALREYPSLYRTMPGGPPAVRVEGGVMRLDEINAYGFGTRSEPEWGRLEPC